MNILRINTLCTTVAKNSCPILTITSGVDTYIPYEHERLLFTKSLAARKLILGRVDKVRCQLQRQQAAAKYKKGRRKVRTKEDVTEGTDLPDAALTMEPNKLSGYADSQFVKEHELECMCEERMLLYSQHT